MARLPAFEEDTQEQAPASAGSFGLTSAPLNSPSTASSASTSTGGFSVRLMLGEGLRGATRSLATFFGHVLLLAR